MNLHLADELLATLPSSSPCLFNPWRDRCPYDTASNGPEAKRQRLAQHLDCSPQFIMVGEAPGYQGCRYTGIAFTSERLILEGSIPRVMHGSERLSKRHIPFSEPSATIIWNNLSARGLQHRVILWNTLQLHPHPPEDLWANRTPTDRELAIGRPALKLLSAAFPFALFIAIGKKAAHALNAANIHAIANVRHPANGGAAQFSMGLDRILNETGLRF